MTNTAWLREEIYKQIVLDVTAGFDNRQRIIDMAVEEMSDSESNLNWLEAEIGKLTDEAFALHFEHQEQWHYSTDCDRLDEVFAELDRNGIVARQHFTCCQTCGHTEIQNEVKETETFRPVRGYVFYHWQDTERVVSQGYLYLAYGSVSGNESDTLAVAKDIVAALERANFRVKWESSIRQRILINNVQWLRRRVK